MAERPSTLERLVFFSDAVFAIAITLLAIDLRLPPLASDTDQALLAAIWDARGGLFAFFLSFFIVGAFWIGHLRTLHSIARTDGRFVALNLVFLFFVALVPFPTSVLAVHGDLAFGAIVYAAFIGIASLASAGLWWYATRLGGLADVTPALAHAVEIRVLVTPAMFLLSIPAALVSPVLAELVWLASFPATALVSRRLRIGSAMERSLSTE